MTRLAIWLFAPNLAEKVEGLQMQQYVSGTSPHFQTTANIFSSGIGQAPTAYVGNEKAKDIKLIQECHIPVYQLLNEPQFRVVFYFYQTMVRRGTLEIENFSSHLL